MLRYEFKRCDFSAQDPTLRSFILTNVTQRGGKYTWQVNVDALLAALPSISGWPSHVTGSFEKPTLFVAGEKSARVT